MDREIKFRGKRTGNNEWMIDMYIIIHDNPELINE